MDTLELLNFLAPLITSVIGYFVGKRKNKADAKITELDAVEKAVSIWRELSQQLREEMEKERAECDRKLSDLGQNYEKKLAAMQRQIDKLTNQLQ